MSVVQFSMVAVGVIVIVPQASSILLILTVGGFFTSIVLVVVSVPQPVVTLWMIVYFPGVINKNWGFSEVAVVPFLNSHSEEVPQFNEL